MICLIVVPELQKVLDRVAQTADRGLPVTDIRNGGDAI